jgi:hypothetical protein
MVQSVHGLRKDVIEAWCISLVLVLVLVLDKEWRAAGLPRL